MKNLLTYDEFLNEKFLNEEFLNEEYDLSMLESVNEDTKYEVFWVDRDYKSGTKDFYDDPQGAAENGLKKAKLFLKKLEDKDKKDRYGLYRDLGVRTISEGQEIIEWAKESVNESRIPNIPTKEWETTTDDMEGGVWAVAKYKGKYYGGVAAIEPGSVNSIDVITDIEVITKKEYDEANV
jgi:hypothetical protein